MKVYISADLEGVSGVVHDHQTGGSSAEFLVMAKELMTAEVNAAIEGFYDGGAKEVTVNDSHGDMRNLFPDKLDQRARLITGSAKPWSMMEGIDETFAMAGFVGYHARAGLPGVLNHTYSGRSVRELRLNGAPVGEVGMNAALASVYNVPVVLVTGDTLLCEEARELLGEIETAAVKIPITRSAANCLSPTASRALIKAAAKRAAAARIAGKGPGPWRLQSPITAELDFNRTVMADGAAIVPGAVRTGHVSVAYTADDYRVVFNAVRTCIAMASYYGM